MAAKNESTYAGQPVLAFTGMSGIFPGSPDVDDFWQRIVNAEVAPLTSLEERWKIPRSAYFDPKPGKPDRVYLDRAFCLPGDDNVGGRQTAYACEAVASLLEGLACHGTLPDLSEVGLVLGTSWSDQGYFYRDIDYFFGKEERNLDALSQRFSPDEQIKTIQAMHHIGGPGLAVDAACASSLYAVEMAAALIRSHQARATIVLGVSLGLPLFLMAAFSQLMALAANGKSLPFSEGACGMVPAEGVGAVLLEPLEEALRCGRKVLGILRAVGLSSDGAEGSVFAPSPEGQHLVYRRAYQGMDSPDVDYIEAHGTATVLGDETETSSIDRFFGPHQEKNRKIPVGSVKALIGHGLATAGMASLIKALLMLRQNVIPPHIAVSPHPRLANSCICLPSEAMRMPKRDGPHRIGISSFGFGGSNAHTVVEGYDETRTKQYFLRGPTPQRAGSLAIVDFEAAFGSALGAEAWKQMLEGKRFSFTSLSEGRFAQSWVGEVQGLFFPDEFEIDTKGLRLGPKMLSRIDPLQNLASYLIGLLVRRHETIRESDDTAVVLCSNMGGGKAHQLARRHFLRILNPHGRQAGAAETSLEELASGLGSMLSGYPALHFDMRGFHQTLSGDIGLFWTTLLTAPSLLLRHCKHLILGGGNYFRTPIDFCHPDIRKDPIRTRLVEGFAVFLLKNLEQATEDGDRILAEVKAIVTGREARNFKEACLAAGVEPSRVDLRESCQIKAGFRSEGEEGARRVESWFLGEASGIEALASALLKEGRIASVEAYSGEERLLVLFLEKRDRLCPTTATMESPLRLSFRDPSLAERGRDPETENGKAADAEPFWRVDSGKPMAAGEAGEADELLLWHKSTADVLTRYLRVQKKMIEALLAGRERGRPREAEKSVREIAAPACRPDVRQPKRRRENRLLRRIRCEEEKKRYSAELVVDETHPYFFDHPLDHVPGLLLIEGLVQLLEVATQGSLSKASDRTVFVREIDVLFTKWCEKDRPVILWLEKGSGYPEPGGAFVSKAEQGNEIVGRVRLKTDAVQKGRPAPETHRHHVSEPTSKHAFLHKHRPENVVVSELKSAGDRFFVEALSPPASHILADGDPELHSCVYLLEASRQCSLMITHAVGGVPLDLSMILLSARMTLRRPAFRHERLTIAFVPETRSAFSPNAIGSMNLLLSADDEVLGRASLHALIVDSEEYRRQRWKRAESKL